MGQKAFYQGKPLRPSLYVCGVDVMGGELTAKIESIDPRHSFWGKTIAIAKCSTVDGPKMLRIGAEIEDSLVELFGADVTKWPGNSITLYFAPEVRFKGRKVGGARIRTTNQTPTPARAEPDAKRSGVLTGKIMKAIDDAKSPEVLTRVSEWIKQQVVELTKTDITLIQRKYKTRQDQVAAVPADPEDVKGPTDPITGDPEGMDPETGEVTGELGLVHDTHGPKPESEGDRNPTHAADIPTTTETKELFVHPDSPSVKGATTATETDGIPDFGGPEPPVDDDLPF